jgi:hypothetical protein
MLYTWTLHATEPNVGVAVESEVLPATSLKPLMSRAVGAILDCLKDGTKWELHQARGTTLTTLM